MLTFTKIWKIDNFLQKNLFLGDFASGFASESLPLTCNFTPIFFPKPGLYTSLTIVGILATIRLLATQPTIVKLVYDPG